MKRIFVFPTTNMRKVLSEWSHHSFFFIKPCMITELEVSDWNTYY